MMMDCGPICSVCTRDWDSRLGYCEYCEGDKPVKKTKKKKHLKVVTALFPAASETPVYEQLTVDFGFAPDRSNDWRNIPGGAGLLEDNFS